MEKVFRMTEITSTLDTTNQNTQICHDRRERKLCSAGEGNATEVISYHKTELKSNTHMC